MNSIHKPALRRRSNRSLSSEEKGGYVFEYWGVEFGKMEACSARLEASLATPEEKLGNHAEKVSHKRAHLSQICTRHPFQRLPHNPAAKARDGLHCSLEGMARGRT